MTHDVKRQKGREQGMWPLMCLVDFRITIYMHGCTITHVYIKGQKVDGTGSIMINKEKNDREREREIEWGTLKNLSIIPVFGPGLGPFIIAPFGESM